MNWQIPGLLLSLSISVALASPPAGWQRPTPDVSEQRLLRADAALTDTFTLQGITGSPNSDKNPSYDWSHGGPKDDKEWAWFLNRHGYFEDLYIAYKHTGDPRYANKIFSILADWISENKTPPSGMSFSSAWRPLEAARRILESWDLVYIKLWDDPLFPDNLKPVFVEALKNHGDYLQDHHALYGNHLITEMLALLKLSMLLPNAENSPKWEQYAFLKLQEEHEKQFYPSGAHKELASHYQRVVVLNYQKLLRLLEESGRDDLIDLWKPRIKKMWEYFAAIQKPSGFAPLNNDSDLENVRVLLNSNGHKDLTAPENDTYFPRAGQVVFRDNSSKDSPLWAFFDIGPRGTDHQHEDFLHLSLSYGDVDLLIDNGRYTYQPGPWRSYFQGPTSHNLILVDGFDGRQKAKEADGSLPGAGYIEQDGLAAAWGTTQIRNKIGEEIANWQRVVVRLPNRELLILDHLVTFRSRELKGFWHSSPKTKLAIKGQQINYENSDRRYTLSTANTLQTDMRFELYEGSEEPYIQGWYSPDFNKKIAAPSLAYTASIHKPTIFAWLFSPEENNASIKQLSHKGNTLTLKHQSLGNKQYATFVLPEARSLLKIQTSFPAESE